MQSQSQIKTDLRIRTTMPNTMQIVEQQLNAGTRTLNQLRYLDSHYTLVKISGV